MARQKVDGASRIIMQRHNRRLYRIARAVMRNDSEAEDVVQEACVPAFTSLAEFRGDSSLATWLSRILLNEALGRIRRHRPMADMASLENRPPSQAEIIPFPLASPQVDPERTMAQRQIQLTAHAAEGCPNWKLVSSAHTRCTMVASLRVAGPTPHDAEERSMQHGCKKSGRIARCRRPHCPSPARPTDADAI
jgi:RNA polymerase sigma factor (sigma-70 family)